MPDRITATLIAQWSDSQAHRGECARSSADPDDITAQINLIGVPWLMIGEKPPAAPNGGSRACG